MRGDAEIARADPEPLGDSFRSGDAHPAVRIPGAVPAIPVPRANQPQALARGTDVGARAGASVQETVGYQAVHGPLHDVAPDRVLLGEPHPGRQALADLPLLSENARTQAVGDREVRSFSGHA